MADGGRVLLTGGCGFIGSHQAVALIEAGQDVVIVDDLSNGRAEVVDRIEGLTGHRPQFHQLDVRDTPALTKVLANSGCDAVIHFAGLKHVRESMSRTIDYLDANVGGMTSLLQAAARADVRRLVFSSSGSVYGTAGGDPITEDTIPAPTNPYSHSKWIGEQMLARLCSVEPDWSVVALRYFNPAGAHPSGAIGEDSTHLISNLVPVLMEVAAGAMEAVPIFGADFDTEDGTAIRDYVHVMDVVEAHTAALGLVATSPGFDVLNIGRGEGVSVKQLIAAAERAVGRELPVELQPRRPGDVSSLVATTERARRRLGLDRYRSIDSILEDAWRFRRSRSAAR